MTTYYDNSTAGKTGADFETMLRAHAEQERKAAIRSGQGYFAESCPRSRNVSSAVLTAGTIYAVPVYFFAGEIIANLTYSAQVVGSGLTSTKYGVYDLSGNLKGITADVKAVWTSAGDKTAPLLVAYTVPSDGVLLCGYCATGTTIGLPARALGTVNPGPAGSGTVGMGYSMAGAGGIIDPATFTLSQVVQWVGVS